MAQKIAIIGFDSLSANGIIKILAEIGDYACNVINNEIDTFQTESYLLYIVSSNILLSYLDFFLPKKNKVLLIISEVCLIDKFPVKTVSVNDGIEKIEMEIRNLLSFADNISKQEQLSLRELDVLKEIAKGKINKEIADSLNISINTVITHRKNISSKLGIRTASGLSIYAIMNGII